MIDKKRKVLILNQGGGAGAFDTDYQAVLNRATALGYSLPSAGQQTKQNTLVLALKSAGVWTKMDILYIFANDVTGNFWKLNWKAPTTFEITEPGGALTKTSNVGVNGNGTTIYAQTGWNPATNGVNYTLTDASLSVYSNTDLTDSEYDIGCSDANLIWCGIRTAANQAGVMINTTLSTFTTGGLVTNSVGFFTFMRRPLGSLQCSIWKNGVQVDQVTRAAAAIPSDNLRITTAEGSTGTTRVLGMAAVGGAANAENPAFYTSWNNYFTSL
jgi:hypothetical protein